MPWVYLKPAPRLPARLKKALKAGMKVEMEHTPDPEAARIIASHHLAECPFYYQMLLVMERECLKRMK